MYKSEFCNVKQTKQILENGVSDVLFKVYHKSKGRKKRRMKKKTALTLTGLAKTLEDLTKKIDRLGDDLRGEMHAGFNKVNARIDHLENRIDRIDTRLDYIVKTNSLKDSK